jgi:hypothetical protein
VLAPNCFTVQVTDAEVGKHFPGVCDLLESSLVLRHSSLLRQLAALLSVLSVLANGAQWAAPIGRFVHGFRFASCTIGDIPRYSHALLEMICPKSEI